MHRLRFIDLDRDLLAAREKIVRIERILVLDLLAMGAGDELHAARYFVRRRHRDPRGRHVRRTKSPIGRVLMPRDKTGIARFLDKEGRVPAQDIGPEQILDRVEDLGMADHLVDPGEQHVAAMAHLALDRAAALGLVILELAAETGDLAGTQGLDREMIAAVVIVGDLSFAQQFRHGFPPLQAFVASFVEAWRPACGLSSAWRWPFRWRRFTRKTGRTARTGRLPLSGIGMRATNLVIGTTTLAVLAAAFGGMLAVQKIRGARNQGPLRIVFNGSASGLRKGGPVNFDGVPAGQVQSIKLESPTRIVALVTLDNSAPIRKDTSVGIEFEGLTGIAAIALVGGAPAAPPVPLDSDGIPVLSADWSEQASITDTLHNVDHLLVDNRTTVKNAMASFESYTDQLKGKADAVDNALARADDVFAGFDTVVARINGAIPGLMDGEEGVLFQKVKSIRELADSFNKRSAIMMEEHRHTLA